MLDTHEDTPVWVLLGEPGGGKSTLLFDLELRAAYACLDVWCGAASQPEVVQAGALPELCLRVSLADFNATQVGALPRDWMQAVLDRQCARPGDQAPSLQAQAQVVRVRWLLDGLNEVRANDADQRSLAQQAFMHWAALRCKADMVCRPRCSQCDRLTACAWAPGWTVLPGPMKWTCCPGMTPGSSFTAPQSFQNLANLTAPFGKPFSAWRNQPRRGCWR